MMHIAVKARSEAPALGLRPLQPYVPLRFTPSESVAAGAMHAIPAGPPEIAYYPKALHQGFYRGGNLTPTFRGETRRGMGVGFSFEVGFT